MVVVGIVVLLSMLAVPSFLKYSAKAKRAEAYMNLGSLYAALKAYYVEHGTYTNKLTGQDSLNWSPDGESIYSYGFSGSEGINYIKGKQDKSGMGSYSRMDDTGFTVAAVADIMGNGKQDVITVDDKHNFKVVQDGLA